MIEMIHQQLTSLDSHTVKHPRGATETFQGPTQGSHYLLILELKLKRMLYLAIYVSQKFSLLGLSLIFLSSPLAIFLH
jgi:hypothetical protein